MLLLNWLEISPSFLAIQNDFFALTLPIVNSEHKLLTGAFTSCLHRKSFMNVVVRNRHPAS
jgi:hypothetical protein